MMLKLSHKRFENFLLLLIVIVLFFQSVLKNISFISNFALLLIALTQMYKMSRKARAFLMLTMLWVLMLLGYSLLIGNEMSNMFRFSIILFLVICAYLWKIDCVYFLKLLFIVSFIQILFLIGIEFFMFTLSVQEYSLIRNEVVRSAGIGDVFLYNDIYYKLELRGTQLLAFIYMLSYMFDIFPLKYRWFFRALYLIGTILAGNFAYQLVIVFFHVLLFLFPPGFPHLIARRFAIFFLLSILIGGIFFSWISFTMDEKSGDSSNIRIEQANVLLRDVSSNGTSLLFGSGLGHCPNVITTTRDYRNQKYYELQVLYFFNQLGLVNFTLLILVNVFLTFRCIKDTKFVFVYFCYLLYSSTNPYILDTTHIVVILSLTSALSLKSKENDKNKYYMCNRHI